MTASPAETGAAFGTARVSQQRRTIIATVEQMDGAFTIDELACGARTADARLGTATVYRAVAALEESGWLERVGEREGSVLYARCGAGHRHHHHVVCEQCGRVQATECPVVVSAKTDGYRITRHEVTLYGICPQCLDDAHRGV